MGAIYTVAIPVSGLLHWRLFRSHWSRGVVQPIGYLKGSAALWLGLTVSTIVIALLALVRGSMLPDLMLVLPPALMLMGTWPSGWPMLDRTESLDDEAAIEEEDLLHVHSDT